MTPYVALDRIDKAYPEHPGLLQSVTLELARGETVALLGRSGSGKTTLLRIIAGLESADGGRITIDGVDITSMPVERRNIGYMFQGFALFPHLTVAGNIAFGLQVRHLPRAAIRVRVEELLTMVDMAGFAQRDVQQLSEGQKQRVAFARALAPGPRLLLLDEPMSALDDELKTQLLWELGQLLTRTELTAVYVTHDQREARTIASRILKLEDGQLSYPD